jgi:hypothetical protein
MAFLVNLNIKILCYTENKGVIIFELIVKIQKNIYNVFKMIKLRMSK